MLMDRINNFISELTGYKSSCTVFNMYQVEIDGAEIRRNNLRLYLQKMKTLNPSVLLLGEAPGYKGARLTGVPFTSEVIIKNESFFDRKAGYQYVNSPDNLEWELSASIVWGKISALNDKPLLWNIFPFHPHQSDDILSNRTPSKKELLIGKAYLKMLLEIFDFKKIIALGRKSESQLRDMDIDYHYVRHPANGGKKQFELGIDKYLLK